MNEHDEFLLLLADRHGLTPPESARLDAHLAECSSCRVLVQEQDRQDAVLHRLAQRPAPSTLRPGIWRRLQAEPERRSRWHVSFLVLPAMALIVLLLAVAHETRPSTSSSAAPALIGAPHHNAAFGSQHNSYPDPFDAGSIPVSPLMPPHVRAGALDRAATAGGVVLQVTLPRRSYSRFELIRVPVLITNNSRRLIWLPYFPSACGVNNPSITPVDSRGREYLPEVQQEAVALIHCAHVLPRTRGIVPPGRAIDTNVYVVLGAPDLLVTVEVQSFGGCDPRGVRQCPHRDSTIQTRLGPLALHDSPAPRIVLHARPHWSFSLLRSLPRHRPIEYFYYAACGKPLSWETGTPTWFQARRQPVRLDVTGDSPCDRGHLKVDLMAGYVGTPVAMLSALR